MPSMEELVKILRTTHLSLLGTMLALAVAWSVSSDVILSEAVEQGREVELLDAVLHRDAMVRFGTSIEPEAGRSLDEIVQGIGWEIDGVMHGLRWPTTSYRFANGDTVPLAPKIWIPLSGMALPLSVPPASRPSGSSSLRDFQLVYDFLTAGNRGFLIDSLLLSESDVRVANGSGVVGSADDRLTARTVPCQPVDSRGALLVDARLEAGWRTGGHTPYSRP